MERTNLPRRSKNRAFQVRLADEMADQIETMLDGLGRRVRGTNGKPLTRTDLVAYWAAWLLSLPPEQQDNWARTYRAAFVAALDAPPRRPEGNPGHVPGPSATLPLGPPGASGGRAAKEDHHGPKGKASPGRPGRK